MKLTNKEDAGGNGRVNFPSESFDSIVRIVSRFL